MSDSSDGSERDVNDASPLLGGAPPGLSMDGENPVSQPSCLDETADCCGAAFVTTMRTGLGAGIGAAVGTGLGALFCGAFSAGGCAIAGAVGGGIVGLGTAIEDAKDEY